MKNLYFLLLTISFLFIGCSDNSIAPTASGLEFKSIHIRNFTGHLIRRGGQLCGEGLTVKFVLSSSRDMVEQLYEADTYTNVALKMERGDRLTVSAYEVRGHEEIFLTRNSITYAPPSDANQDVFPTIEICPRDRISFYDMNDE